MRVNSSARQIKHFNLIRWFSITALASISLVSVSAAWIFSGFLTDRMIRQDAEVTAGFVRSIVATENAYSYFDGTHSGTTQQLQAFFDHMNRMPGVLRTNVYAADRTMIWSSDESLIGKRFENNDELEEALQADLVIHSGIIPSSHLQKLEHQHLAERGEKFVESYVPIFDVHGRQVVGAVELYKVPIELFEAIKTGVFMIWMIAAAAGFFLFATLFWVIRRAQRTIELQEDQLVENESLAVVGEMGSAVAHGLRNPLAAIRSSAELSLESPLPPEARDCSEDIIHQVDRLEGWIRQLLSYAKPAHANLAPVDINAVLDASVANFAREMEKQGVTLHRHLEDKLPPVRGDENMLVQMVGNLISNSIEAMDEGGQLTLRTQLTANGIVVAEVQDNGPGISPDDMKQVFKPFFTSKAKGLGLGLPLVRRVIERLGGSVEVDSTPKAGTTIRLHLPIWR